MENNSLDFIDFKMLDFINEFSELFKSLTEEKDLQNEDIKRAKHLIHISKEIENSIESCDIFDLKNESLDQNLELQKEIKKKKLEEFNQIRQIAGAL